MSVMSKRSRQLLSIAIALAASWSVPLHAATLCTHIIQAAEYPIPMDERESERQVQARIKPEFVADADKLASDGELAAAVDVYAKVFSGFSYRGLFFGNYRCLPTSFYEDAADRVRSAATELAAQRMSRGYFLDERHEYGGDTRDGALWLFLVSNQYDAFTEHAFDYATSEIRERDIDHELGDMVQRRLTALDRMRQYDSTAWRDLEDDSTQMLDAELAAFDKLADFDARLRAHLAPRYPEITDFWLAEETRHHDELVRTGNKTMFGLEMGAGAPVVALEEGVQRLEAHPIQVERLTTRANSRGEAFMATGQYAIARDYFEVAGNSEAFARADELATDKMDRQAREVTTALEADVEKFQKTEEEKASFEKDTDEMAREFGFDLDE